MPALHEQVEQDKTIQAGATASVIAHLSLLALLVVAAEVHPLSPATEPIPVNIVTPEEAATVAPQEAGPDNPKPEPLPQDKPQPELALPDPSASTQNPPAAAAQPPVAPPKPASAPQPSAKAPAAKPDRGAAVAAAPMPSPAPPPPAAPASPAYRPAEPDLSVKYNVILGLPVETPPAKAGKSEDGFDETTSNADIASTVIAQFRRHLKSCSKLPASVLPSDHITIKLRVAMTQDGRLAADPMIGGGSANPKAIEMLQSAIAGLKQCQPYKMLPADRYGEWKVLDLDFTPKDFSG